MAVLSPVMEDYLKAIYQLQEGTDGRVSTTAIAEYLEVTPPTVTSMLDKLAERSLIDREKYEGVHLTADGERVALEVIRHHRLLEAYLAEHLDFDWVDVHDEADRLEHHISEELERQVASRLEDPEVDPHGSPIPGADLTPPEASQGRSLVECEPGDRVTVMQVPDREPDVLDYLADHDIEPGQDLDVVEMAPIGLITVTTAAGEDVALPAAIAKLVRVESPG